MEQSAYPDNQARIRQARQECELGRQFFKKNQWKIAARHFAVAEQMSGRNDIHKYLYRSYHGLSLVNCGDFSGLNLCRNAASMETIDAEVFLNLALAELKMNHRKRACDAVSLGLEIDPRHADLLKLRRTMGMRRKPVVPFLKRENPLNKWLGKATYRHNRRGRVLR